MDILRVFSSDKSKEQSGAEVQIGEGTYVTVARSGNKAYNKLIAAAWDKNKFALDRKDDDAEALAEKLTIEAVAKTILKGWRGFTEKGVEVEYSYAKALEYLAIRDFRQKIMDIANDHKNYKQFSDEDDAKN